MSFTFHRVKEIKTPEAKNIKKAKVSKKGLTRLVCVSEVWSPFSGIESNLSHVELPSWTIEFIDVSKKCREKGPATFSFAFNKPACFK